MRMFDFLSLTLTEVLISNYRTKRKKRSEESGGFKGQIVPSLGDLKAK